MERSQFQSHTTEPDAIDLQAFTDLEETERQGHRSNGHIYESSKQPLASSSTTKPDQFVEPTKLDRQEQQNGNGSHHSTTASENAIANDDDTAEDAPKGRSPKRRGLFLGIGAIAFIFAAFFGFRWWQFQNTHVSTDNAQLKGHLSPISAKVPATVQKVLVNDGDFVKAGQTLLVLEDQDLNLKLQQAEANLAAAQAQLRAAQDTVTVTRQTNPTQVQQAQSNLAAREAAIAAAQASVNQAIAKVQTNEAGVAQAQTDVQKTQADLRRYELLYNEGAIPAQQLDTARAAYNTAQAQLAAANQTVAQSQSEVRNAQADLQSARAEAEAARGNVTERQVSGQTITVQQDQQQQAQAQVKQAEAALALAQQQIGYTVIKAPISGYVGQLTAQVGQKVENGQPLLSVVPLETEAVYVDANFKETALNRLQIGESAEVEVDAYPGETFRATIAGISPATGSSFALLPPDNATGNFNKVVQWVPVRLVFDAAADPQHRLRPGLNVKVIVDTTTNPQAASVEH
ncbi:HlyD family secretion protein [Leptolyngbya sp. FACHB-16]|uniref:HlyD family secretion protein n=1 Tax=unclassified Leptolyngbya TaxID=2650499 RepID=UPI0016852A7C|nr:HlyD family secretion protein [Leptolyngbya sp. FACHB-16]MBD2157858.1 HlyD family secretion protein [Leptolyngbya sp. FACHB-16]